MSRKVNRIIDNLNNSDWIPGSVIPTRKDSNQDLHFQTREVQIIDRSDFTTYIARRDFVNSIIDSGRILGRNYFVPPMGYYQVHSGGCKYFGVKIYEVIK